MTIRPPKTSSMFGYASSSLLLLLLAIEHNTEKVGGFVCQTAVPSTTDTIGGGRKRALQRTSSTPTTSLRVILRQGHQSIRTSQQYISQTSRLHQQQLQFEHCFGSSKSPVEMAISVGDLHIAVTDNLSYASADNFRIETWRTDKDTGTRRTWTTQRSEEDFTRLGTTLRGAMGTAPAPPPPDSSPAVFEGYLRRILEVPNVIGQPVIYEFLDAPPDVTQEPVLFGEVVSSDFGQGKRFRSADPDSRRTEPTGRPRTTTDKAGAALAGAVVGGLVAGPVGAAIGAVAGRAAVKRDDGVGDVAKGAAKVADAALGKAQDIESEFAITRKAGKAARSAAAAVKKADTDLRVSERATTAAKRALAAAKKADKDHKLRERAGEAARSAGRNARRAAEAARKAEREHRVRERAANALRRVRSRVHKSVEDLREGRRKNSNDDH